jgi:hypothetical protein
MHVLRSNLDDTVRTYYYVSTSCHDKRQETAREHACRASQEPAAGHSVLSLTLFSVQTQGYWKTKSRIKTNDLNKVLSCLMGGMGSS